jgi:hypothetical protein
MTCDNVKDSKSDIITPKNLIRITNYSLSSKGDSWPPIKVVKLLKV